MKHFILFFLVISFRLYSQEMTIQGEVEWERMELNATITLNLKQADIKLPAGRTQAESLLEDQFTGLIDPHLMGIQADSSSTVADLINRGELSPAALYGKARNLPPALSPDMSVMFARYSINLYGINAELIRHSRPQRIPAPLIPSPVRDYTGIIIIADENLPVHGKSTTALALPCLFPKIWDSEMNLVFERNMMEPDRGRAAGLVHYTTREKIMRSVPSSLDDALIKRVGSNPLRIVARGLFGAVPTDPIIDREDALLILSSEHNRQLLREGRIVIVLDKTGLKKSIP